MKARVVLVAALTLVIPVIGQNSRNGIESAKEVLLKFLKMELAGARLPTTDSSTTSPFFVEPQTPFLPKIIFIVSDTYDLTELPTDPNTAKISVFFYEYYGELDPTIRFTTAPKSVPGVPGGIVKNGISADYTLIATEKPMGKETVGSSDWKIANTQAAATIDIAAATNYVREVRRKTSDATIKSNADKTLADLAKLR